MDLSFINNLCKPAYIYLVINAFFIFFSFLGAIGYQGFVVAIVLLLFQIMVCVFWTWLLNLICSAGYTTLSWVLVMFPIIATIIILISTVALIEVNIQKTKKNATKTKSTTEKN